MSTYSNIPSINFAMTVMERLRNLLLKMTPEEAKETVNRQAVELSGAAKISIMNGDQAGAALLMAVAEILKLARKTNSVQPLASLQMAIQFLDDYRDANEGVSIPF